MDIGAGKEIKDYYCLVTVLVAVLLVRISGCVSIVSTTNHLSIYDPIHGNNEKKKEKLNQAGFANGL